MLKGFAKKEIQTPLTRILYPLGYSALFTFLSISSISAQTENALTIAQPRFTIQYDTGESGINSFTSLGGFFPLIQSQNNSLTFLQSNVLLDNGSNLASNFLLGHRFYNSAENRIFGGYISYGTRNTNSSNFNQLGLGFESLGTWDFRLNASLPLGKTEQLISQTLSPESLFQGQSLMIPRFKNFEVSLSAIEAELGTEIAKLGQGNLRGYAGIYYYTGGESQETIGWKTRLEARPNQSLSMNLSLQQDSIFETRAAFSIGLTFPSSSNRNRDRKDSILSRMTESVEKSATILVTNETRKDQVVATIPNSNGQPFTLIHVASGAVNGNGSFESPYGSLEEALNRAKPGNIIYVRPLGNPSFQLNPFTIPDGVTVLSSGPVQFVNTQEIVTRLPESGLKINPIVSGIVPEGAGLVTLGNNTVLSGFTIQGQGGSNIRGILGENLNNIQVESNEIKNMSGEGIYLEDVGGTVQILGNTVSNSQNVGISVNNINPSNFDLRINNNILKENFNDVMLNLSDTTGKVQINNNTIHNAGTAIDLQLGGETHLSLIEINQNKITGIDTSTSSQGINLQAFDDVILDNVQVSGNIIDNMINGNGIAFQLNSQSRAVFTISDNTIQNILNADSTATNFTDGIFIEVFDNSHADITIARNHLSKIPLGNGIYIQYAGNGGNKPGKLDIIDNTINQINIQGNAIDVQLFDDFDDTINLEMKVNILNNNIFDIVGTGINVYNETPFNQIDLTVNGNTINNIVFGDPISIQGIP